MNYVTSVTVGALLLLISGCGDDDGPVDTGTPPTVESASPESGTSDASLLQDFRIGFSEAMDPATLDATTVTVDPGATELHLAYDAGTDELHVIPLEPFPADTDLTLSISEGATDLTGEALDTFSLEFSTGPMDCAHLADRLEPNEDFDAASEVAFDEPLLGLSTCEDDEDVFQVTVEERTKVNAVASFRLADDIAWGIHWERSGADDDEDYATLGAGVNTGSERGFAYTFEPGTYFVRMFSFDDESLALYDLTLESSAPCEDDVYEDNDFRDEAAEAELGVLEDLQGCFLDADWFSVPVEDGRTIRVTIDPGDYAGLRRLRIVEPGGQGVTVNGELTLELPATADGNAQVMAQFWADDVDYDLEVELVD